MRRPSRATVRQELGFLLQLVGVCGFVFARPVLASFGASPETLLEVGATGRTVVLFGVLWVLGPPFVLWAAALPTRWFGTRVRTAVHVGVLAVLVAIFVAQSLIQSLTWSRGLIWVLAVLTAVLAGWLWLRFVNARQFVDYLAAAPALFLVVFLFFSPAADILGGANPETAASGAHVPVVFLTFDEFPTASLLDGNGGIDASVFPNFARLASMSTWYRNNTTVASTTGRAVPAILSGRIPADHPVAPVVSQFPQNLFTMLGPGYTFHVEEPLTALCPPRLCAGGAGGGVRHLVRPSVDLWKQRFHRAAPVVDVMIGSDQADRGPRFEDFTRDIASTAGPRLDFVHAILPHVPWNLLPSGRTYDEGTDNGISPYTYAWVDPEVARVGRERHLLQLQYTDHLLGEVLDRLQTQGALDRSLVVVTADHGVAFDDLEPLRATTPENLTEIAWSPLFIKSPGQTSGRVDDRNAESVDILPTVADIVGVKLSAPVDGRSLRGPARRSTTKYLVPFDQNQVTTDANGRIEIHGTQRFQDLLTRAPGYRGRDALAPLRTGAYPDVVGRAASTLGSGSPVAGSVRLDEATLEYDPPSGRVPTMVRADVRGAAGATVALVVNGVVAGTYTPADDHRARFVVSESFLRPGRNDLSISVVDGPVSDPVLHPIGRG